MSRNNYRSRQSQVVDQNFANGTLYMTMSTFEELYRNFKKQNGVIISNPKTFGRYDQYDYSSKSIRQLLLQAVNQLMLLSASTQNMLRTYKSYQLPTNYDINRVLETLEEYYNYFMHIQAGECMDLSQDCMNILKGAFQNMKYPKVLENLRKNVTRKDPTDLKQFTTNLMNQGIRIQKQEQNIKDKGQQIKISDLQFKQNTLVKNPLEKSIDSIIEKLQFIKNYHKSLKKITTETSMANQLTSQNIQKVNLIYEQRTNVYQNKLLYQYITLQDNNRNHYAYKRQKQKWRNYVYFMQLNLNQSHLRQKYFKRYMDQIYDLIMILEKQLEYLLSKRN